MNFFSKPRAFNPYTPEFQELLSELRQAKAEWWIKPATGYNGPIISTHRHPSKMRGLVLPNEVTAWMTGKNRKYSSSYTHTDPTTALKNAFELWLFAKCEVLV
jgi:hypothetical protein